MKTYVIIAELIVNKPRYDMLARMLLHKRMSSEHIHLSVYLLADIKRLIRIMHNISVHVLHIGNKGISDRTVIGRLSASFGIKISSVQYYFISVFRLFAVRYNRFKLTSSYVFIKQFIRHINHPLDHK